MNTSSDARNPVEALAEEFLDRKRRGEQPTLREYVERYPELADDIRDLFPALLMVEDLGESSGGTTVRWVKPTRKARISAVFTHPMITFRRIRSQIDRLSGVPDCPRRR